MKKIFILAFVLSSMLAQAQQKEKKPATLKSILLEQMRGTHDKEAWFVPVNEAVKGLTADQAKWTDGKGNHSVAQLASHIIYWNLNQLAEFKGEKPAPFSGNNDETFNSFTNNDWNALVQKLDSVFVAWEKAVEAADEQKLATFYQTLANINTHTAYHTGQMIFVRKLQGAWKK